MATSRQTELEKRKEEFQASLEEQDNKARMLVQEKQVLATKLKSSEEGFARDEIRLVSRIIRISLRELSACFGRITNESDLKNLCKKHNR